jgi:hypothetical protein
LVAYQPKLAEEQHLSLQSIGAKEMMREMDEPQLELRERGG